MTTAKDRALRLLGVRARSREELRRRLAQKGHDEQEITSALDDLEAVGLVDDEAFAREMAEHRMTVRGSGKRDVLSKLRAAGVAREVAERIVEEAAPEDEEARAEEVARSRLGRLGTLDEATAYRRLLSFLQRRGYDGETSRNAARRALAER
jgi:regulatory protein